jgi:hypothetical protein
MCSSNLLLYFFVKYLLLCLYYNSEIWLLPSLNHNLKQQLLLTSACALRTCITHNSPCISFTDFNKLCSKPLPDNISKYKLLLVLHKAFNSNVQDTDWLNFNNQIILTGRKTKFIMFKTSSYKIGLNIITNRFHSISNKIELNYLNLS